MTFRRQFFAWQWQRAFYCVLHIAAVHGTVRQTDRGTPLAWNRQRDLLCINKHKASLSLTCSNTPLNPQRRQAERQFITLIPSDTFHKQFIHWFVYAMSHSCSYIIKRKYLADSITWHSLTLSLSLRVCSTYQAPTKPTHCSLTHVHIHNPTLLCLLLGLNAVWIGLCEQPY